MEDFDKYLNSDSNPEEREAAKKLKDGLSTLRLEEKVRAAAAERASWQKRRRWPWVVLVAALALLSVAAWLFYVQPPSNTSITPVPPATAPALPTEEEQNNTPQEEETAPAGQLTEPIENKLPSRPMAQALPQERLAAPRYAAPEITTRGSQTPENSAQSLLHQIWYADYPLQGLKATGRFATADSLLKARNFTSAYITLHRLESGLPRNDTLGYLKGYCLMQLGQGEAALPYFDAVKGHAAAWDPQLEWYRGLSMFQSGDKEGALEIFKAIAAKKQAPFQAYARKALRILYSK